MFATQPTRVPRRSFIIGLAAGSLVGCSVSPVRGTSPAEVPDRDARRRWDALRIERDLAALLAATGSAHPDHAEELGTYADLHRRHVTTLRDEGPLPRLIDPDGEAPTPDVSESASEALTTIIEAEDAAVEALLTACTQSQGPRLAAILASVAASDAAIATNVGTL